MGAVHTKEGVIMFAKQPTTEDGASFSYIAYNVSNGVSAPIVSSHELTDLDRSLNFTFVSYKDGFLAHDSIAGNIFYYTDSASKAKKIEAPNLNDAGLSLAGTSSLNGGFMTVFSNRASKGDLIELNGYSDLSDKTVLRNQKRSDVKPSTKVVIYKDGGTKQLSFNEYFSSLVLCGTNKLCGVSEDSKREMTVYDISGKNTVKLYSIENVRDLRSIKSGLLLVRDNNVVAFDADSRSGYIEYSVGLGGYCGIYEEGDNYLVCVADSKSNSAMLLINRAVDATYKIDLVVADLLTLPQVKDVSAYKEKLFVTLDTGEDIYDESLRSFVFDKAKQKAALAVVTKKLNDLGLDLKAFELIPLPQ